MSLSPPAVIESDNLSLAWAEALVHLERLPRKMTTPLFISVGNFSGPLPPEVSEIRAAVDAVLKSRTKYSVDVSAMTIFPQTFWSTRKHLGHQKFSDFCVERLLPRLQARNPANRFGTYFGRMMRYSGSRRGIAAEINQLSFVIKELQAKTWRRQSALQISCFDPAKDHTGQTRRGFPCLQQVGISHDYQSEIAVNAFYPTQDILDRGYGNYLGLCHLGAFIAECTGLNFARLNCYVGSPLIDAPKRSISPLVKQLEAIISPT